METGSGKKGYQDGPAQKAQFDGPTAIQVLWDNSVLIADKNNHRISIKNNYFSSDNM